MHLQMDKIMNTPTAIINDIPPVMRYWGLVKNMDNELKLELLAMIVESMREHPTSVDEKELERGFRSLAGCWANDQGNDDMESIIREGREGRQGSRVIPSFDCQ